MSVYLKVAVDTKYFSLIRTGGRLLTGQHFITLSGVSAPLLQPPTALIPNYPRRPPVSNDLYILEFFFIICTIFGSRLMGCRAEALLLTMMTATVGKEKEAKQSSKAQATCGGCG